MTFYGYDFIRNPVEFVKASKRNFSESGCDDVIPKEEVNPGLSGDAAKNFYENILKSSSSEKPMRKDSCLTQKSRLKKSRKKKDEVKPFVSTLSHNNPVNSQSLNSASQPKVVDFFKAAEAGSLTEIQKILDTRLINIDATDLYAWTALMMAAHQGHEEVVKYLLVKGAEWEDKIDGSGYDAYDLACLSGHDRIAHMLTHRKSIAKAEATQAAIDLAHKKVKRERLWCDICEVHYTASSYGDERFNDHHKSISHQFCHRSKEDSESQSSFYLSSSNKGYKLLRTHGWDGNSGLGPSSSGRKYPIKTVLKRDRSGLGCETDVARVTHFNADDNNAIKSAKKVKHKHVHRKREEKLKKLEVDFRRSFY